MSKKTELVPLRAYALIDKQMRLVRYGYTERDFTAIRQAGDQIIELLPRSPLNVIPAVKRQRPFGPLLKYLEPDEEET